MNIIASNTMETVSGRFIDLNNPTLDDIDEHDIGWGLSRIPRYAGHTVNELLYSVGQHSIFVTETIQRVFNPAEYGIRASLHDFAGKLDLRRKNELLDLASQRAAPQKTLLAGLLHDGSEAYILDVPTPLKSLPGIKEAYGALETKFMQLIHEKFGLTEGQLPIGTDDIVRWADSYTLTIEAYHLMRSRGKGWPKMTPVTLRGLQEFKLPYASIEVYENFMNWLEELSG